MDKTAEASAARDEIQSPQKPKRTRKPKAESPEPKTGMPKQDIDAQAGTSEASASTPKKATRRKKDNVTPAEPTEPKTAPDTSITDDGTSPKIADVAPTDAPDTIVSQADDMLNAPAKLTRKKGITRRKASLDTQPKDLDAEASAPQHPFVPKQIQPKSQPNASQAQPDDLPQADRDETVSQDFHQEPAEDIVLQEEPLEEPELVEESWENTESDGPMDHSGSMFPALEDLLETMPRITRKRGIFRPKSSRPSVHLPVFIPKSLDAAQDVPNILSNDLTRAIFHAYFRDNIDPALTLPARNIGVKIPRAVHVAHLQRLAIQPHNRPSDRPDFLKALPMAVPFDTPLTQEHIESLAQWLRKSTPIFEQPIQDMALHLHSAIYRGRPNPPAPHPVMQQPGEGEQESNDLALEAIFDIFTPPITPLIVDSEDLQELAFMHITNHATRITTLLGDWARSLAYIDRGAFGGPDAKPLYMCFIERFDEILKVDFEAARAQNVVLRDYEIRERYSLDNIDLLLLWLLAALELDPTFKAALRTTWDQPTVIFMSAGTLMRFICGTQAERIHVMSRISPSSPMVTAGLIRIISTNTPTQPLYYELVIAEQVIKLFAGIRSLSAAATQYAELQYPHFTEDTFLDPAHQKTIDIVRNYLERPLPNQQPNLERENLDFIPSLAFLVEGLPGSGRATFIKIVASKLSRPFILVQGSQLSGLHPADCEEYLRAVFIDATLMNAIVCIRDVGPLLTEERSATILARQLSLRPVICALCVELAVKTVPAIEPYITFKTKMDANLKDNAAAFWIQHLHLPHLNNEHVDVLALSQRLALQPIQIQKATKLAYYQTEAATNTDIPVSNHTLERCAAVQVIKNIGNLAFVTDPEVDLSDVIVSDDIMEKIKKIIGSALNRRRVLYEWGLSKRIRRGTGVIALFDGEPGTGKTHSAEAIAHELGLSLMRINIANMVDKYIGETEKNLTTIFEQARPDMQLLLFDEADSLFTKRTSNVSKSNDRYSNMSVNVLLQLVERYEGVSILTTNLKNAIDPAFERRITYKVYFPMPKKPERERLWRYMCPPEIVTSEPIDYEWLSDLEMSGGEIKNAVLTAAFTAATQGVLLNSTILYDAGVSEASAAGRVMRRYEEGNDFLT